MSYEQVCPTSKQIEDLKQEIEVENSQEEDLTSIDDLPPPPGAFYEVIMILMYIVHVQGVK